MTIQGKLIIKGVLLGLFVLILGLIFYAYHLKNRFFSQVENNKWYQNPVEIYAYPKTLVKGSKLSLPQVLKHLEKSSYKRKKSVALLHRGSFVVAKRNECKEKLARLTSPLMKECLLIFHTKKFKDLKLTEDVSFFLMDEDQKILKIYKGFPLKEAFEDSLAPQLFIQMYEDRPVLRQSVELEKMPATCSMAITAAEDAQFLDHGGFSVSGILRAAYKNLLKGRKEGGSTITQQFIKNYFLTPEKTFKRKFDELLLSIMLEGRLSKDEILSNYLNIVYMGQEGPLQIRGYASASSYYFERPLKDISTSECALLAALVKSPGNYNPFLYPERAQKRRDLILEKMEELGMISKREKQVALGKKMPSKKESLSFYATIPYFVQALKKELKESSFKMKEGLKIYTSLDMEAQKNAQKAMRLGLKDLKERFKLDKNPSPLQGSLLSVHIPSGSIKALIGGVGFKETQFNRVTMSQRQVGSTIKPFIYLEAFRQGLTPFDILEDGPLTHKEGDKIWQPKNYKDKYFGRVPLYFALKNSLNTATVRLALKLGLEKIIETLKKTGIKATFKPFPSLALGAFEVSSWDLTQGYLSLSRMGSFKELHAVLAIEDSRGATPLERKGEEVFSKENVALLLGLLKKTAESGTARAIKGWGFDAPMAAKTGTTNDMRDSWFVGMTPYLLTTTWVGYDDNASHGLSGASGALPLWAIYMKKHNPYPLKDFSWPRKTKLFPLNEEIIGKLYSEKRSAREEIKNLPFKVLIKSKNSWKVH